ncbi:MAG TPA: conjugal transfer protein TraR [Firmicutes bacterium]|nr:conjugal transfer protein TraR [Bacillota bacterium]
MDERALQDFRLRLLGERDRFMRMIDSIEGSGLSTAAKDAVGELSSYDNHPADEGSNLTERERDVGTRAALREMIKRVDDALERISAGTYGVCERCGNDIEVDRLQAVPYASLCARCAIEMEMAVPDRFNRPIEEAALRSYDSYFRDRGTPGIDGEDVWQEVARYGTANSPQDIGGADDVGNSYIEGDETRGAVEDTDLIIEGDEEGEDIPPLPDVFRHRYGLRSR